MIRWKQVDLKCSVHVVKRLTSQSISKLTLMDLFLEHHCLKSLWRPTPMLLYCLLKFTNTNLRYTVLKSLANLALNSITLWKVTSDIRRRKKMWMSLLRNSNNIISHLKKEIVRLRETRSPNNNSSSRSKKRRKRTRTNKTDKKTYNRT